MKLSELKVYQLSIDLAEKIWGIVCKWNYFEKSTVGSQMVKAADSIAANLSEGFGRYHYNENKQFCYYSRGSLFETKTWLEKSFKRKLIEEEDYLKLNKGLEIIGVKLNNYIKMIGKSKINS